MEKFYSAKEVSEILSVALVTVYKWLKEERIKSVKIGKSRRIPESELLRITGKGK